MSIVYMGDGFYKSK